MIWAWFFSVLEDDFQIETASESGLIDHCSTWNTSNMGPLLRLFHVEQMRGLGLRFLFIGGRSSWQIELPEQKHTLIAAGERKSARPGESIRVGCTQGLGFRFSRH